MSTTATPTTDLDDRDVRALREHMRVHEDDPDAWGDHEVAVYSEDRRYLVNLAIGYCDCPSNQYHDGRCKHERRARYALGIEAIPSWVQMDSVDDQLRQRLEDGSA